MKQLGGDFMTYQEMPETMRRKFRRTNVNICPICNEEIHKVEDCQYISYPYLRYTYFHFIHTSCLLNAITKRKSMVNQQEDEVIYTDTDSVKVVDHQ